MNAPTGQAGIGSVGVVGGQYLTFGVAGEMYGIGILAIKEIIQFGSVSAVPLMPDFIRGVINLRGSVVPVLDLEARLHGGRAAGGRRSCIVVVEFVEEGRVQDIGLLVDSVSAVLEIRADEIEPAPAFGGGIRCDFIAGMGKVDERFIVLLDVERVLETEDLVNLALTAGPADDPPDFQ